MKFIDNLEYWNYTSLSPIPERTVDYWKAYRQCFK